MQGIFLQNLKNLAVNLSFLKKQFSLYLFFLWQVVLIGKVLYGKVLYGKDLNGKFFLW